jgi:hypothetical protein
MWVFSFPGAGRFPPYVPSAADLRVYRSAAASSPRPFFGWVGWHSSFVLDLLICILLLKKKLEERVVASVFFLGCRLGFYRGGKRNAFFWCFRPYMVGNTEPLQRLRLMVPEEPVAWPRRLGACRCLAGGAECTEGNLLILRRHGPQLDKCEARGTAHPGR